MRIGPQAQGASRLRLETVDGPVEMDRDRRRDVTGFDLVAWDARASTSTRSKHGVGARGRRRRSRSSSAAARRTWPSPRPATGAVPRWSRAPARTRSAATCHEALRGFGVDDRVRHAGAGPADPGDLLRGLPAGRLPAVLLPLADGARPGDHAPTSSTCDAIRDAGVFWATVTGLSPGAQPRRPTLAAWQARARRRHTVLDLDYRPMFWADPGEARRARSARPCEHVTVAVGNLEECEVAVGETRPAARRRRPARPRPRARRRQAGPQGRARRDRATSASRCRPFPVEVVNGLGAGDAFGGALVPRTARGLGRCAASSSSPTSPERSSPARLECSTAMPDEARDRDGPAPAGRSGMRNP